MNDSLSLYEVQKESLERAHGMKDYVNDKTKSCDSEPEVDNRAA